MDGSSGWLVSFHDREGGRQHVYIYDIIFKLETIRHKNGTTVQFNTAWPHIFLPQIEIACGDTAPMFGTSSSRNCRLPTHSGCGHRNTQSRTPSWFSDLTSRRLRKKRSSFSVLDIWEKLPNLRSVMYSKLPEVSWVVLLPVFFINVRLKILPAMPTIILVSVLTQMLSIKTF